MTTRAFRSAHYYQQANSLKALLIALGDTPIKSAPSYVQEMVQAVIVHAEKSCSHPRFIPGLDTGLNQAVKAWEDNKRCGLIAYSVYDCFFLIDFVENP